MLPLGSNKGRGVERKGGCGFVIYLAERTHSCIQDISSRTNIFSFGGQLSKEQIFF